ncbi:MAG: lauroyl acyltransferase [Methylocystaceae bacterium]|nr:lauroyl acyltransferase [Methylocystaceae bacterium]
MQTPFQKYVSHPIQGVVAHILFFLIAFIPFDQASAIGGWIGRKIGPFLSVHKLALDNLEKAFPQKTSDEIQEIALGVWDNVGRTLFEIPHVPKINIYDQPERFEVVNGHIVDQLREDGVCGIFFSGHMANWEFLSYAGAQRTPPLPLGMIYRAPDNPWVADIFDKRKPSGCEMIPKGAKGAKMALNTLKDGGHLAILADQKMNDGISVPFFGRDAMTAPAMAQFALKFNCPIVPCRIERIEKTKFRLTFYEPMEIKDTGNRQQDIATIMKDVNGYLEEWISEQPEQWLWLHHRWPRA